MPPKADKLQQNIDTLKNFLLQKIGSYPELLKIIEQIKALEKNLQQKKLTLQIISNQENLTQAIFDLITEKKELAEAYEIKYDAIPELPTESNQKIQYNLILETIISDSLETIETYQLESEKTYLIGRCPDNQIILDNQKYQGVSWQHAELKLVNTQHQEEKWQITDLNSSNGIFINGEKLAGSYNLNHQDKITFASAELKTNIASFQYLEENITPESEITNIYQEVVDCDLLIMVIDNIINLSDTEKKFLITLDTSMMSKQFLVMNIAEENNEVEQIISQSEEIINQLELLYKFNFLPLYLKPYYDQETSADLSKAMQKKLDKFIKELDNLIKRQPENILAKRIAIKLTPLVQPLESILMEEDKQLKEKIKEAQEKLIKITAQNWKDITKTALTNIKEDKDKFFKQIKSDLAQAKASILDNFSRRSVTSQIKNFVDELQPIVFKKEGQPHVKLIASPPNADSDLNRILIDFSTKAIENWALTEWDKIINTYNDGGLNNLLTKCYQHIQIISDLFPQSPFHSPANLDIKNNFAMSFMPIESELRHNQISMAQYIMKSIRSNMMQIMMMLTMVLSLVGLKAGKNQIFAELSKWFKDFPFLLGLAVFALVFFLTNSYNQENNLKLEEAAEKLRKEVTNYYQSLSKNLVEKVFQDLNLNLEYEASRLDDSALRVQETYNDYIAEMEKQQIKVKANLDLLKEKENNLSKEILEFKKLIR